MKIYKKILIKIIQGILWCIDKDHRIKEEISMDDMKKFTDIQDVNFKSDFGHVSKVFRTVPYEVWELKTTNHKLYAADKHRVINEKHECVWLEDLKPGDKIKTDTGIEEVISSRSMGIRTHMYCIQVDSDNERNNHLYYSDGILSHNTTCAAAYILWRALFNPDQTILIAANKFVQAMEIMDRIRYSYETLPDWLRAGVTEYNKGTITFDNGSQIISRATSPDAGRGLSISLLYLDEFAFVRPTIATEFWTAMQPTLSCLIGNTLVLTDKGYRRIEDYHIGKNIGDYFEIDNLSVWGKDGIENVSHGYVSPDSDTLIVETSTGHMIETTLKHPLYVLKETPMMVETQYLSTDDYVRIDVGMNQYGDMEIDENIAYMLGGYIAEGWIVRNSHIEIENTDDDFRNVFLNNTFIKPFHIVPSRQTRLRCSSVEFVKYLNTLGIDSSKKCFEKVVPYSVFEMTKKNQTKFLQGLFDGDGSITERSINLTSTSKQLIQEVQLLLNNIGITSTIFKNDSVKILERERKNKRLLPSGKEIKSLRDSWSLNISRSQYKIFSDEIGFNIKRKQTKLLLLASKYSQRGNNILTIPTNKVYNNIMEIFNNSGKSMTYFRKNGIRFDKIISKKETGYVTIEWLTRFSQVIQQISNDLYEQYNDFWYEFIRQAYWDRIVKITPSKNKTYDFTVPKTHSFLQNGILGSNTGGDCIITSTPNNDEDQFSQIWFGAENRFDEDGEEIPNGVGRNGFKSILVKWDQHPERGEEFEKKFRGMLGDDKFSREFNCIGAHSNIEIIDNKDKKSQISLGDMFNKLKFGGE